MSRIVWRDCVVVEADLHHGEPCISIVRLQ